MATIKGTFCEARLQPKAAFDARSFRWKVSGKAWVLVGCPRGQWQPRKGRCAVGLKAYALLRPAAGRCPAGARRLAKG